MIIRGGEIFTMMQHQEDNKAPISMDKEHRATTSTPTGNYLLLIQCVLSLYHFLQYPIPQNLGVASKLTTFSMDSMFFFTNCLLHLQAVLRVSRKMSLWMQGISGIWYVISTALFLVPHFVMLTANKLTAYCLFLKTTASIYLQCLCFYIYPCQH